MDLINGEDNRQIYCEHNLVAAWWKVVLIYFSTFIDIDIYSVSLQPVLRYPPPCPAEVLRRITANLDLVP